MFVSHAQNFEDVILFRALKHISTGFYIDIGAQQPVVDSTSFGFYVLGWRGVHVEPNRLYAAALRAARPDEPVLELAIGAHAGVIPFFDVPGTGLSTGDAALAAEHAADRFEVVQCEVACIVTRDLLDRYGDRAIHWLKIDVEGFETQVIQGWTGSPVRPWIVVIEATKPNSQEPSHQDWEPLLLGMGYDFVYFDGLNRFYVSQAHPELKRHFGPGPNVFDRFTLTRGSQFTTGIDLGAGAIAAAAARKSGGGLIHAPRALGRALRRLPLRIGFHAGGRPRRWLRRLLFHSSGRVRGLFRRVVFHRNGAMRALFARSMGAVGAPSSGPDASASAFPGRPAAIGQAHRMLVSARRRRTAAGAFE